jgi:hypothetical protein
MVLSPPPCSLPALLPWSHGVGHPHYPKLVAGRRSSQCHRPAAPVVCPCRQALAVPPPFPPVIRGPWCHGCLWCPAAATSPVDLPSRYKRSGNRPDGFLVANPRACACGVCTRRPRKCRSKQITWRCRYRRQCDGDLKKPIPLVLLPFTKNIPGCLTMGVYGPRSGSKRKRSVCA